MATPLTADQLLRALRNEGVKVQEHTGWRTNNRNHKGPWGPVHGVMIHHTVTSGTASSVELCFNGHSALPGPLCHGVIDKAGVVHLVGNGRANHAGLGDSDVLEAVMDERAVPADDEADTDGNRYFYGFECINLGDGKDPWPAAQLEAIERAAAALCRVHGWSVRSVIRHLDWQPGKVDPRGVDWAAMQARIAVRLAGSSTPTPEPPAPPAAGGTYTVKSGDTLSSIGTKLGVPWPDIAKANGITTPYRILPGQVLKIPAKAGTAPAPLPKPAKPVVDLSKLVAAFKADPPKSGTPVSYPGVRTVDAALIDEGLLAKKYLDGHAGYATRDAYAAWQRRLGYSGTAADGLPGKTSLTKLGQRHGFTVVA